jgi:hypothetical protein
METDTAGAVKETAETDTDQGQQTTSNKTGRPPPIVLTSTVNLIKLQKDLKSISKAPFEMRSTENGIPVLIKEMGDYTIRQHFEQSSLNYFTFHPKTEKPLKAVIRHVPSDTPAENISNKLQPLGFTVISVRHMTTTRRTPEGGSQVVNLPLFLITLSINEKNQEIFKLRSLSHVVIKVEAYRAQTGLTQWYNCQKFGHV